MFCFGRKQNSDYLREIFNCQDFISSFWFKIKIASVASIWRLTLYQVGHGASPAPPCVVMVTPLLRSRAPPPHVARRSGTHVGAEASVLPLAGTEGHLRERREGQWIQAPRTLMLRTCELSIPVVVLPEGTLEENGIY